LLRAALGSENGRPILMSGLRPTDYQMRHIEAEMTRLNRTLSPQHDNRERTSVELARLFAAFPAAAQSEMPATLRMEAYFEALANAPAWAVGEARARILRGEVLLGHRFAPTPPELAHVVRLVLRPIRADIDDLARIIKASTARSPSDAERKRVNEGFVKLGDELRKSLRIPA
jgi:hypothetical protein